MQHIERLGAKDGFVSEKATMKCISILFARWHHQSNDGTWKTHYSRTTKR